MKQPELSPVPGTELYVLDEQYSIVLPVSGRLLTISKGFTTDGASIPRLFWSLVGSPFDPDYMAPALCHDALYEAELMERQACDMEFKALLDINSKAAMYKSDVFYRAVRFGGFFVWMFHSKVDESRKLVTLQ